MREHKEYGILKRALTLLMVATILVTLSNPLTVQAKVKTVKPKAVHNIANTYESYAKSVSKKVTKGTTRVYLKQYMALSYGGCIRFTAPKTKTYTFKISGLKHPAKKGTLMGGMTFYSPNEYTDRLLFKYVKTKGGTSERLNVANPKPKGLYYSNATQVYYTSRTGKVKLKKGETIYMEVGMTTHKFSKKSMYFTLKIS